MGGQRYTAPRRSLPAFFGSADADEPAPGWGDEAGGEFQEVGAGGQGRRPEVPGMRSPAEGADRDDAPGQDTGGEPGETVEHPEHVTPGAQTHTGRPPA